MGPFTFYTVGYGGSTPSSFVELLEQHGVRAVADVRIWPIRAVMGAFSLAKDADKGIAGLLGRAGIDYRWWAPLGNPWFTLPGDAWVEPYRQLLARAGELLTDGLEDVKRPWALLCGSSCQAVRRRWALLSRPAPGRADVGAAATRGGTLCRGRLAWRAPVATPGRRRRPAGPGLLAPAPRP